MIFNISYSWYRGDAKMGEKEDIKIIEKLVEIGQNGVIKFQRDWINDNFKCIGLNVFKNDTDFINEIKMNNEFVLKIIIIYSFERVGYNAKVPGLDLVRSHAVSVLWVIEENKKKFSVKTLDELIVNQDINTLSDMIINDTYTYQNNILKHKFNKNYNRNDIKKILNFYRKKRIDNFKNLIIANKFKEAYKLLINELRGIGNKVSRFIVRDFILFLKPNICNIKLDINTINNIQNTAQFAIPIDRWVRRVSCSVPLIFEAYKNNLLPSDFFEDSVIPLDNRLIEIIVNVCLKNQLNPFLYDLGAYLFGYKYEKEKNQKDIYLELEKLGDTI